MSFILDALKKSEMERQRQAVPGLMDAGTTPARRGFPVWAIALAALLAVNLLVLLFVMMRHGEPAAAAPPAAARSALPAAQPAAQAAGGAAAQAAPFSPLDSAPSEFAPEIPVDQPADSPAEPRRAAIPHAVAGTRAERRVETPPSDAAPEEEEVLPSISELDLTSQGLADLHIDVHVFATNPADRFVYINMRKYHEGATLQEGPKLERIRRDGAVLSYRGVRFFLPRQSS